MVREKRGFNAAFTYFKYYEIIAKYDTIKLGLTIRSSFIPITQYKGKQQKKRKKIYNKLVYKMRAYLHIYYSICICIFLYYVILRYLFSAVHPLTTMNQTSDCKGLQVNKLPFREHKEIRKHFHVAQNTNHKSLIKRPCGYKRLDFVC